jgi:DNA polymerase III delta subunit
MPRFAVIAHDALLCSEGAQARVPAGAACERHYASALKFDTVFAQLGMPDMFATSRAYIYVNFLELDFKKGEGERFATLLERLPEEVTLICTQTVAATSRAEQEKLAKRAEYRRVVDGAVVDDLRRLSDDAQATRWLIARAREQHGLALSPAQARRIYLASGEQLSLAAPELAKLALLKDGAGVQEVAEAQLDASLSVNPQAHFYELADAVLGGNPRVQELLSTWFAIEPETHRLVGELRRRFLGLRSLALGEQVFPPYFAKQLRDFAPRWPAPRLRQAIARLAELEFALKSGGTTGETSEAGELNALQMFLATLR